MDFIAAIVGRPFYFLLPVLLLSLSACAPFPLQRAAMDGQTETVRSLLDRGAGVNENNLWTNETALMEAARAGHYDIVKMLLDEHADIDARNLKGNTALMAAAGEGRADVVRLLIDRGAAVLTRDHSDRTPLMWAAIRGDAETVRLIRNAEAKAKAEASKEVEWRPGGVFVARTAAVEKKEDAEPVFNSDVDHPRFKLTENPDDFALVIGIEKYSALVSADFAERDAEAVRENLIALGYPARNILYLTGERAGRASIEKYVESWLPRNVNENSRVLVYFSGHGAPDVASGDAYLVPWDGDAKFLENTGYSVKRLYKKLNTLKAKQVIVAMDSCFSGAGGRSVIAKGTRPLVNKVDTGVDTMGKLVVFSASSADEVTGTEESQGHGIFTYYFLKGLAGAAKNGDGEVTVKGLYDYLEPKVQDAARRQNRDQTPQLMPADMGSARRSLSLSEPK